MLLKFLGKVINQGPPDLEDIFRKFFRKRNNKNGDQNQSIYSRNKNHKPFPIKYLIIGIAVIVVLIWGLMGIYIIQPAERAAILVFGKFSHIESSGVYWHPPFITKVLKKNVERLDTVKLDKLMLTSEENVVHVSFTVQYRIGDLENFFFETNSPSSILRQALESSVRQVVGENKLEKILTTSRTKITQEVQLELEKLLKKYRVGLLVNVIMQPAQAPSEVKSAFDDVIKAREDRERLQNEAQGYSNKIIPIAKGKAQRILNEAEAYSKKIVFEAQGNVAKFRELLIAYNKNPSMLSNQMYFDTMELIYRNNKIYVVDGDGSKNLFYGNIFSPSLLNDHNITQRN